MKYILLLILSGLLSSCSTPQVKEHLANASFNTDCKKVYIGAIKSFSRLQYTITSKDKETMIIQATGDGNSIGRSTFMGGTTNYHAFFEANGSGDSCDANLRIMMKNTSAFGASAKQYTYNGAKPYNDFWELIEKYLN